MFLGNVCGTFAMVEIQFGNESGTRLPTSASPTPHRYFTQSSWSWQVSLLACLSWFYSWILVVSCFGKYKVFEVLFFLQLGPMKYWEPIQHLFLPLGVWRPVQMMANTADSSSISTLDSGPYMTFPSLTHTICPTLSQNTLQPITSNFTKKTENTTTILLSHCDRLLICWGHFPVLEYK